MCYMHAVITLQHPVWSYVDSHNNAIYAIAYTLNSTTNAFTIGCLILIFNKLISLSCCVHKTSALGTWTRLSRLPPSMGRWSITKAITSPRVESGWKLCLMMSPAGKRTYRIYNYSRELIVWTSRGILFTFICKQVYSTTLIEHTPVDKIL